MFKFFKVLLNIFITNIILFYNKFLLKKKTIVFYHENYNLLRIHSYYIENLLNLKKSNYFIIYFHSNINLTMKNYFFIINYFCEYIYSADIFISNNVCDFFTKNSKKIYMHHDIMDTPLVSSNEEKNLKLRLDKYDLICTSSKKSSKIFSKLLKKNIKNRIVPIGYHKLDYLLSKNFKKKVENKIIIAPTNFHSFKNFSLTKDLCYLIDFFLKKTSYTVIYRPHPSNIKEKLVKKLVNKYKKNKRFRIDQSSNYHKVYMSTKFMITDLSGTAYTYAFLTKNPVVFYCSYKKSIELKYSNLLYFKKRVQIGIIIRGRRNLKKIQKLKENNANYKNGIKKLLDENFTIGETKKNFIRLIDKL